MATLEDLAQSISELSDEELAEYFRTLRLTRRTAKVKKKAEAKSESKSKPKIVTPPPVSSISPDFAAELLKKLGA